MKRSDLRETADLKNRKDFRRRALSHYKAIVNTVKRCAKRGDYGFRMNVYTRSEAECLGFRFFRFKHRDISVTDDYNGCFDECGDHVCKAWIRWN